MFAGSCIGVICLVMVLELLRRVQREYDNFILPKPVALAGARNGHVGKRVSDEHSPESASLTADNRARERSGVTMPRLLQQAIRATIHMLQFAVAYFIMLLAMYYNGKLAFYPIALCS